jgi:hypothetical protein
MTEARSEVKTGKRTYVAIFIRPETRRLLAIAKIKGGFRSYDELILHLLRQVYADKQVG